MDIKLGLLDYETPFQYAVIDYGYQLHGTVHTTPSGAKRVQYAREDKYLFTIKLTYVTDGVWDDLMNEVRNSKLYDLNLIIGEDNYTVRIIPETIPKIPIIGTAEGFDITFSLIEV
jgi:hypothetical protein